eukprot:TRINITY_DN17711_c0_g1_i1.p1 TRINITY_DN17711_c0_g1~~TRINITY_DN17711_c0_g1_i1.p1  ORF type:complete len:536 (-),score=87.72 TRINITY_DN17711_c0_g1_i1:35-1591(-)
MRKKKMPPFFIWKDDKQRMTATEINTIIRNHYYQVQSDYPFLEDYYYQGCLRKQRKMEHQYRQKLAAEQEKSQNKSGAPTRPKSDVQIEPFHIPLCDTKPYEDKRKKQDFSKVLGRYPGNTPRGPRPTLDIKTKGKSKNSINEQEKEEGAEDQAQPDAKLEPIDFRCRHSFLIAIENTYADMLYTEDLHILMTTSKVSASGEFLPLTENLTTTKPYSVRDLFPKLQVFRMRLFKDLRVPCVPVDKYLAATREEQLTVAAHDLFFLKLTQEAKGSALLARIFQLLKDSQLYYTFLAYLRNFEAIILYSSEPTYVAYNLRLAQTIVMSVASRLTLSQAKESLRLLFFAIVGGRNFAQVLQQRICVVLITAILRRAVDWLILYNRQQQILAATPQSPARDNAMVQQERLHQQVLEWRTCFDQFWVQSSQVNFINRLCSFVVAAKMALANKAKGSDDKDSLQKEKAKIVVMERDLWELSFALCMLMKDDQKAALVQVLQSQKIPIFSAGMNLAHLTTTKEQK